MKGLILVGCVLLGISVIVYFTLDFSKVTFFAPTTLMGISAGVGLGLIFGGIVGYISKGSAMKEEQKRNEMKRLQKEKEDLQKLVVKQKEEQQNQ
ncbi:MAG: hypothetical protein LBE36_00115 [Flavobacteriaceae bacterium]|jgi:hypothetical protein|nr:hypothetical protein [Flavobacteriaceae bacterium]